MLRINPWKKQLKNKGCAQHLGRQRHLVYTGMYTGTWAEENEPPWGATNMAAILEKANVKCKITLANQGVRAYKGSYWVTGPSHPAASTCGDRCGGAVRPRL